MKKTAAFHTKTKILPDQRIEVQDPNFPVGETVDVFVVPQKQVPPQCRSVIQMIEEIRSHRKTFTDAEEIDKFLAEERESWASG